MANGNGNGSTAYLLEMIKALSSISNDISNLVESIRYVVSRIDKVGDGHEDIRIRLSELSGQVEGLRAELAKLSAIEAKIENVVAKVDENTDAIDDLSKEATARTEKEAELSKVQTVEKWKFWSAVVGALLGLISTVVVALLGSGGK